MHFIIKYPSVYVNHCTKSGDFDCLAKYSRIKMNVFIQDDLATKQLFLLTFHQNKMFCLTFINILQVHESLSILSSICVTLILLASKMISLCHKYSKALLIDKLIVLILIPMIMDSSKNGRFDYSI